MSYNQYLDMVLETCENAGLPIKSKYFNWCYESYRQNVPVETLIKKVLGEKK